MTMKRLMSLLLALLFVLPLFSGLAEDFEETGTEYDEEDEVVGEVTDEELAEIEALDAINEADEEPSFVVGETWH